MANKDLEFHPEARLESRVSVIWYRQHSSRAAEDFLAELDAAFKTILQAPQRWPADAQGFRHYRLHRFPFVIVYHDKPLAVQIIAVAHASRNPGYWKYRLT
jgi:plasmid stabilization system protein ParE